MHKIFPGITDRLVQGSTCINVSLAASGPHLPKFVSLVRCLVADQQVDVVGEESAHQYHQHDQRHHKEHQPGQCHEQVLQTKIKDRHLKTLPFVINL